MDTAANIDHSWLSEPATRETFMRFPLPIAIIGATGSAELANDRFTRQFDAAVLESDELRAAARGPEGSWQSIRITCRDGRTINAWTQALRVRTSVIVVIEEAAAPRSDRELEALRARIAVLEKQSASDHLTGAWNRAHLDRSIAAEIARSDRYKQPVSLVLFDIDHFKRINDTYGHLAGDAVLRELVALSATCLRKADILFRWGGEEFVILAMATGYRNAEVLAESLRRTVERHTFDIVGSLTISLGVAEHVEPEGATEWFRRVDEAMYSAKSGGRNCVVVDRRGNSDIWADPNRSALRLVWQEAYECGEPTIDREHRELFDLANAAIDASFSKKTAPDIFRVALDRLLVHIVQHFHDEEALLEQRRYPRLKWHKAAHAKLLERALELKVAAASNEPVLGTLVDFLANDVTAHHLFTADRDFFPLFRAS